MTTLRQIIDKLGEQYMDAELSVIVVDGHLNTEWMPVPLDYSAFPREEARPQTNEPARLTMKLHLDVHRLVKNTKRDGK